MSAVFDSHAHLQDPAFADDRGAVLSRARAAGLAGVLVLGYDVPSSREAVDLARANPGFVFAAAGIHPHDAGTVSQADIEAIADLAGRAETVAVGEIGLDFYRNHSSEADQRRVLDAHLAIALEVGKPVAVHSRGAEGAIHQPLRRYADRWRARHSDRALGVMHCFGGTLEEAETFTALGFLVSVACVATYPRSDEVRRVAAGLPLDRLLVETDSPYLPPQGQRGRRNEPANVVHAAEAVASARGSEAHDIASATTRNALRLFGIMAPAAAPAGSR